MRRMIVLALLSLGTLSARAEESATVTTHASAHETLHPTRAAFDITILNNARLAPAARTDNATTTAAVTAALQAAGIAGADIKSSQLTVAPHWTYSRDGDAKAAGIDATNRLHIETHQLDAVGVYLDAALNAGAKEVSAVSFSADDVDQARHRALAHAVAIAEADAAAIAQAANRTLGSVVVLSTEPLNRSGDDDVNEIVVTGMRSSVGAPPPPTTAVVIPDITVTATVNGRWRLDAPPR